MNNLTALHTLSLSLICRALSSATLLMVLAGGICAQSNTQGSTPAGLAPGAPAGSYALSDFESVNLYNGTLNFALPLLKVGGRGGGGHTITLNLDHKWAVTREINPPQPAKYYPYPLWMSDEESNVTHPYGVGKLIIRQGGTKGWEMKCGGTTYYQKTLTRLTFTAPGGTEYELRDAATAGEPKVPPCNAGFNRGKIFVTADGSAATFISDSDIFDAWWYGGATNYPPSGYMILSDGSRYRINDGEIKWVRDRNGNQMTFASTGIFHWLASVTDQLNRQTSVTYASFPTTPYDEITFKGFEGAPRSVRINYTALQNALRSGFTIQTDHALFPELNGYYNVDVNPSVVGSITLPDGRQYQFFYNSYAELSRVVLPTGAAIEYDYAAGVTNGASSGVINFGNDKHVYRRVVERRVYPDGGSGSTYESRMTYSRPETTTSNLGYVVTDNFGPGGVMLGRQWHYFHGSPRASFGLQATEYSAWQDGREYWTYIMAADGTTVLRQIVHTFAQRAAVSWWAGDSNLAPPNDVRLVQTETTLMDSNQVTKQIFGYDQFNNLTDTYDYDYGNQFVRRSHTDYLADYSSGTAFNSLHIRNLPIEQWVSSGIDGSNMVSRTTFEYDNYTSDTNHNGLVDRERISGMCTNYSDTGVCSNSDPSPPDFHTRGNATAVTRWLLPGNTPIRSYAQYDIAGNVVKTIDSLGNQTSIGYDDNFGAPDDDNVGTNSSPGELGSLSCYAFPTSVTNSLGHIVYSQYDFYLGVAIDAKDANGVIASSFYNDDLDRPTQVILASNIPALRQQKTFAYDDDNRTITVTGDLRSFNDNLLKSQTLYDKLGRTTETRTFENATDYVATKQVPFELQQENGTGPWRTASRVSNPFRPLQGEQPQWTVTLTDALGRGISVTTPDDAKVKSSYLGNATTVEDQAGKKRKSETDALGRLRKIYEAPNDASFNFQTVYTYSPVDNLLTVTQGSETQSPQVRTFAYDSLSRLTSATNPESGTIIYTYDDNGNLKTKKDARLTMATFFYDALNRLTKREYSGGTAFATPTVNYLYDTTSVPNSKGRLTSVSTSVSTYNYTGYDALGRVTGSQQITDGQTYSMSYVYDLAGNMTSQTYPTGRVVTQSFDNVGRMASISGQSSGGTPKTYANSFGYTAHGAVERMRLGNGRWEHTSFNNRLQPTEIGLGISPTNSSLLKLEYYYGTEQNNGNVLRQIITVPTIGADTGFTATQHYQYDPLNRLTGAQEANGVSTSWQSTMPTSPFWQQMFSYDRFGNRAVVIASTTSLMIGPNPQINATNNRISPRSGEYYFYDDAGNMTRGQSGDTLDYDAENKLVRYQGGATQSGGADYSYDGDGRRVKKARPSETLIFVYNICGQLVAEYTTSTTENNGASYLTSDTLGTPRVITKSDGAVRARHDYLPFGEELFAGDGNRTANPGQAYDLITNPVDKTRQKFTQKERDGETGLDYFLARYLSSSTGRFTSADPLYIELGRLSDPQQVNLYIYTRNNPLKYIDPTGLDVTVTNTQQEEYKRKLQENVSFTIDLDANSKVIIVDANGKELSKKESKALGKTLSGREKALFNAITDTNNHATIDTGNGTADPNIDFGSNVSKGNQALDFTDIRMLDSPSNAGGMTGAEAVGHETLEAYKSSTYKGMSDKKAAENAHKYAASQFGGLGDSITGTFSYQNDGINVIGYTEQVPVYGGRFAGKGIKMEYSTTLATPIPVKGVQLPTTYPPANITSITKRP